MNERTDEQREEIEVRPAFWQGKRVFLTGHTGFKGAWLSIWLWLDLCFLADSRAESTG